MKYKLTGKITPKARPRLGRGGVYLPANYRDWKQNAILELLTQPRLPEPMSKAAEDYYQEVRSMLIRNED